ncbi:MAG TPA: hypothetical protein VGE12_00815 [Noviherbaspirillum sp.]
MDRENIPEDISRFVLLAVPSVPYLEAMLLMRRERAQPWDFSRVAGRIYVSEKVAQGVLAELHAGGVVAPVDGDPQGFEYRPQSQDLDDMIGRLATIYARNLVGITNLIHSKTNKKAQQFADAFIWRKDS